MMDFDPRFNPPFPFGMTPADPTTRTPGAMRAKTIGDVGESRAEDEIAPSPNAMFQALFAHLPLLFQAAPQDALMMLRASLPFVPIMQFPINGVTVVSDGQAASEIIVPDRASLVRFTADADFVVNMNGIAKYPTDPTPGQVNNADAGIINATDVWFYLPNVRTISVIGKAAATTVISAQFLVQL